MKALTICQPYAHLIAIRAKTIENRTWATGYRGELLIHAGKSRDWLKPEHVADHPRMAFGAIVAVATLVNCLPLDRLPVDLRFDPYANGPFCWVLDNIRRLSRPIPASGAQGLWSPDARLFREVSIALDALTQGEVRS